MRRALAALVVGGLLAAAMPPAAADTVYSPAFAPLSGGARGFALSGAVLGLTRDADAVFVNPARLAFLTGPSVAAGYGRLVEGLPSERGQLAGARPLGQSIVVPGQREGAHRWAAGAGLDYQRLGLSQGSNYGEVTGSVAGAFAPANIVAFGAALRGLASSSGVAGLDARGVALDLGFSLALMPCLELAAVSRNLAGSVRYGDGERERPGWSTGVGLALTRWRWAAAEVDYRKEYAGVSAFAAGVELTPIAEVALRGGARKELSGQKRMVGSLGLGLGHNGYFLDYSAQFEGDQSLGIVHRVSLVYRR